MSNSSEELKVGDVELSEYEFQMLKLKQGLYISYPRIIALLESQQAELEATKKEIRRLKVRPEGLDFIDALKISTSVFAEYKNDHLKWWKRMDGTPILNDVSVRMAEAFVKAAPKPEDE